MQMIRRNMPIRSGSWTGYVLTQKSGPMVVCINDDEPGWRVFRREDIMISGKTAIVAVKKSDRDEIIDGWRTNAPAGE